MNGFCLIKILYIDTKAAWQKLNNVAIFLHVYKNDFIYLFLNFVLKSDFLLNIFFL